MIILNNFDIQSFFDTSKMNAQNNNEPKMLRQIKTIIIIGTSIIGTSILIL